VKEEKEERTEEKKRKEKSEEETLEEECSRGKGETLCYCLIICCG
jgi:hypothetical protein